MSSSATVRRRCGRFHFGEQSQGRRPRHCIAITSNSFCVYGADGLPMTKVLDFGISKLIDAGALRIVLSRVRGSPRYILSGPYQAAADIDGRTDIWSIDLMLYEFLAGAPPVVAGDPFRPYQRVRFGPPRSAMVTGGVTALRGRDGFAESSPDNRAHDQATPTRELP